MARRALASTSSCSRTPWRRSTCVSSPPTGPATAGRHRSPDAAVSAPADLAALEDEAFATALMTTVREAFRQGVDGYAQDVVLQGKPWAFDLYDHITDADAIRGQASLRSSGASWRSR